MKPSAQAQIKDYELEEAASLADYSYKIIKAERKKDDPKNDQFNIKITVTNKSEFASGKIPPIKLSDEAGKEYEAREPFPVLDKNASGLLSLTYITPKTGNYKLKVAGDETGVSHAFINLSPKITNALNELMDAAKAGDVKRIEKALSSGANVFQRNADTETALMLAARAGKFEAVKFLLEKGSDYKAKNQFDETALFYAIYAKNFDCVKILLEKGSDTKYKNYMGKLPLDQAKWKKNKAIIDIVRLYTDQASSALKQKSDSK